MRAPSIPLSLILFGLLVHPLGAAIVDCLWAVGAPRSMSANSYLFATALALLPLSVLAGTVALVQREAPELLPFRRLVQVGTWAGPLLSLAAQVQGARWAHTDAQGALLYVFAPLYAGAATLALMLLALLGSLLLGERRRSTRAPVTPSRHRRWRSSRR